MLHVDKKDDNEQTGVNEKHTQLRSGVPIFPIEETKEESGYSFYQRQPERDRSLTIAALTSQPEIA